MDVGAHLRRCRSRAGLSQHALAQAAGTSQPTVAAYEAGRVTPKVDTLARLLAASGYTIDVVPRGNSPRWTRVEEKSLSVHRQIAARLLQDPTTTLHKARLNLSRLRSADRGHGARWLDEWDALLERPTDQIVIAMLARTQQGIDLRQMTPFAGVLSDAERRKALRSVPSTDAALNAATSNRYDSEGGSGTTGWCCRTADSPNRAKSTDEHTSVSFVSFGSYGCGLKET